jgi:hypothetical protein
MVCVELDYESDEKFSSTYTTFGYENDKNISEEFNFTEDIFDD